jgi:hypothetical protein
LEEAEKGKAIKLFFKLSRLANKRFETQDGTRDEMFQNDLRKILNYGS